LLSPPEGLNANDFERIEAAVMETERGRWFLQEYARRCRTEATTEIVAAIARLEALAAERDARETETRREAARAAASLTESLQKLYAFALGSSAPEAGPAARPSLTHAAPTHGKSGGDLDHRLAALQSLDALDIAAKMKLFG
jgi:hypothetical protein